MLRLRSNAPSLRAPQFENLTAPETQEAVLGDLQRFLGLDVSQAPPALPLANSRKAQVEGWRMTRTEYAELVWLAQQQSEQ